MSLNDLRADTPLDPGRKRPQGKAARGPAGSAPRPGRQAEPPGEGEPRRARPERKRRRRGLGLFRLFFMLLVAGGLVAAVAGYGIYRQVAQDLPDYRWLADYKPPQMSRIYAADSRLTAELATERRVFVPIEAIPERIQQAEQDAQQGAAG